MAPCRRDAGDIVLLDIDATWMVRSLTPARKALARGGFQNCGQLQAISLTAYGDTSSIFLSVLTSLPLRSDPITN